MKKVLGAMMAASLAVSVACAKKNDDLENINRVGRAGANAVTEGQPTVTANLKKAVPAPELPLTNGGSIYQTSCKNPIVLKSRASEKDANNLTDVKGDLKLESLLFFTESWMKSTDTRAHLLGQWINDRAYVLCHTVKASSSQLDSVFTVPMTIDYETRKITSEGRLDLQARGGEVGAQFLISKVDTKLPAPSYNNSAPKGIVSNLVKTVDGKLVLRLNFTVKDKRNNGHSEFWAEATYAVEARPIALTKAPTKKDNKVTTTSKTASTQKVAKKN